MLKNAALHISWFDGKAWRISRRYFFSALHFTYGFQQKRLFCSLLIFQRPIFSYRYYTTTFLSLIVIPLYFTQLLEKFTRIFEPHNDLLTNLRGYTPNSLHYLSFLWEQGKFTMVAGTSIFFKPFCVISI